MVKSIRIDKRASSATIRFDLNELRILANSIEYATHKHEVNLLSLPPDKEEKQRLAEYASVKKSVDKILSSLI
jgi:hypothetical protein